MKPEIREIKLSEIVFDDVIYPRKDHDPVLVQRYVNVLDEIEAQQKFISVSADNKLLDGKHRWLAYRKKNESNGDISIKVFYYDVSTPHEQLKLAASLNSSHGWQLSDGDKQFTAITLYGYGCTYDDIADTLSVGKKKVSEWLSRTVKEEKNRRNERIFDLWLSCHTQQEIAESVNCARKTVDDTIASFGETVFKNQSAKSLANHATDFDPPIYNIWKQQTKSDGSSHFGNNQFARRNLTPFQRAEIVLKLEPVIAAQAKDKERERKSTLKNSSKSPAPPVNTRAEVAKAAGVSEDTIAKTKAIVDRADEFL